MGWHISDEHMANMHPEPPPEPVFEQTPPEPPPVTITPGFLAEVQLPYPAYESAFGETEEEARLELALKLHMREHGCPAITVCDTAHAIWRQLFELNPMRHMPVA